MVNHPRWRLISWTVQYLGTNLPRCMSESWKVRGQRGEPSTPVVDIMDGSFLKHEPAHEAPLSRRSLRWRHQPPREGMRRVGRRRWCARSALPRHGGRGEIKTAIRRRAKNKEWEIKRRDRKPVSVFESAIYLRNLPPGIGRAALVCQYIWSCRP